MYDERFIRRKYLQKLRTAEKVAQMVKSGDRIFFGEFVLRPEALDQALAEQGSMSLRMSY